MSLVKQVTLSLGYFLVILTLATLVRSAAADDSPEKNAAQCVNSSSKCSSLVAQKSLFCRSGVESDKQPYFCRRDACIWCLKFRPFFIYFPCSNSKFVEICAKIGYKPIIVKTSPKPKPSPKPPVTIVPDGCVWTGSGAGSSVVIDLGKLKPVIYWPRVTRKDPATGQVKKGLIYKNGPSGGISPKGKYGVRCFDISAPKTGKYYFSAISYAPHVTEHNDVWVQSKKGFELWKGKQRGPKANGFQWLKAYQNNGKRGFSDEFKTIDYNGHIFIIPNVIAWKKFQVCISGRSKLYEIYKLVLVKCESSSTCKSGMQEDLDKLRISNCNLPKSTPPPTPSPKTAPSQCVWTGSGAGRSVVVDLGIIPPSKYWKRTWRQGMKGLVYKNGPPGGISKPGAFGKACFNIRAPKTGKYYFSAISYAPHNTEHNDVWVSSSKGFHIWKWGKRGNNIAPNKWTKAYQNNGRKGISDDLKTVDHNGHRFIIPNVTKWKKFQICISGRSKLYEIYKLILVQCEGFFCEGGVMKGLEKLKSSNCNAE